MDQTTEILGLIQQVRAMAKKHAAQVDDPKCAALCETSAEVLSGLEQAFNDYLAKSEAAWQ